MVKDIYNLGNDIFYDQFWTVNRVEFVYEDMSFELNLPYGYYHSDHVLYINDTHINKADDLTESLNPFTYRVFFNKKPLKMDLYIQDPDGMLGYEIIQNSQNDYTDYALYSKLYDPDPFTPATTIPYFLNSSMYKPYVDYIIDGQYSATGDFSEVGINTHEFIWNFDAGEYSFSSALQNIIEPVYTTHLFNDSILKFVEKTFFDITYDTDTIYMGDLPLEFNIRLLNPDGDDIGQDITVTAENAHWDTHDKRILDLDIFTNYSGTVYHFETGTPSNSGTLVNGNPVHSLLGSLTYPYNSIIIAPEIIEYNPSTQYSKQQIEIYIVLDLSDIIEANNLDPSKDISYFNGTIFGSSFIDSLQNEADIISAFSRIEIYNDFMNEYESLFSNYLINDTLEWNNPNNPLTLSDLMEYQFNFTFDENIYQYIDSQSRVTFKLISSFEGTISNPDTYISTFDKPNTVLGTLLDYVKFDVVWWKETPEYILYEKSESPLTPTSFKYKPTAPGKFNITFEYDNPQSYYMPAKEVIEITVARRPLEIELELPTDGYSTENIQINATATDLLNGAPAINVKVNFYSLFEGNTINLGSALTDEYGVCTLSITNLFVGHHSIWAESVINEGRHSPPYKDDPFEEDYWDFISSPSYPLDIYLSQSSLELISLAPNEYDLIVNEPFYIYPKLMDLYNNKEVFNEPIELYVNSISVGTYYSGTPFLFDFPTPGLKFTEAFYDGTLYLDKSYASLNFNAKRLELSIIDLVPSDGYYYINQPINVTVLAFDLSTQTPVANLPISLYNNISGLVIPPVLTEADGTIKFTFTIPENWVSEEVSLYAMNEPIPDIYLERRTREAAIKVSPYNCSILFNILEPELFINEDYTFTLDLFNIDLEELVNDETLVFTIYKFDDNVGMFVTYKYINLEVITGYNNTQILSFSDYGEYKIEIFHEHTTYFIYIDAEFSFDVMRRPTHIIIEITDQDLVPENEFSITVHLIDSISNEELLNQYINVYEIISDNGSIVEVKEPFELYTGWTNTFTWIPLRAGDFEFIFKYELIDAIHQNSNYSIIFTVKKRQVEIISRINSHIFQIDDIIEINSTFIDLNSFNLNPISELLVHYLIKDGDVVLYSENFTTDSNGEIIFEWQIPTDVINRDLEISIITAKTNTYHWAYYQINISTLPLSTYFDIVVDPYPSSYMQKDITFDIELFNIKLESIYSVITYEIVGIDNGYYEIGTIDLQTSNLFIKSLTLIGDYVFIFYYDGSDIFAPTSTEIQYSIELFPSSLDLIEHPEFIYHNQERINLTYLLVDTLTGNSISNCEVKLYFIDFDTYTIEYLGLEGLTDINGMINFLVDIPVGYSYNSLIIIAETPDTLINKGATNTFEFIITKTPTTINIEPLTDELNFQYYINDTLEIQLELYDIFGNQLDLELLNVEIETPSTILYFDKVSFSSLKLNFTELGSYRIYTTYDGSDIYLASNTQIIYTVSPFPTNLEIIEPIPDIMFADQNILLMVQLKNNITDLGIKNQLVKLYFGTGFSIILSTDNDGIVSYQWEIDEMYIHQNITIYAAYEYVDFYENCSTSKIITYISKYELELQLIEFPDIFSPFKEDQIEIKLIRLQTGELANNCHFQIKLLLPDGTSILLRDGFTDELGLLKFNYTPSRIIFDFSEVTLEIQVIEDSYYYGGIVLSQIVPVDKIKTNLHVDVDTNLVIPGDVIDINFSLFNEYSEILYGQPVKVEIENVFSSFKFSVIIGVNDTYSFTIPNYGIFEVFASYHGNDRHHACSNETVIYSERFDINIDLSVLEAYTKNKTCGRWNFTILNYNQNFTIIANVTVKDYNIPLEGIEVFFYFKQHFKDSILIGSNITNKDGIAVFYWDTSNYTKPKWWISSVLYGKVEKTIYNNESVSDPIYFSIRKLLTYFRIDTFTSKLRVDVTYKINITLFDEFSFMLKGYNVTIKIYSRRWKLVDTHNLITNESTYFLFTPTQLGNYRIRAQFSGTEAFHGCSKIKIIKCIEKEPTKIIIGLPDNIVPGKVYNISIKLLNSTRGLILGELIRLRIMYHDDTGDTQYFFVNVITGFNSTFEWIFPEFDDYVIKAKFYGSDDYVGSTTTKISHPIVIFSFSFWEIFFLFATPCLMLTPSFKKEKGSNWSKRKKILVAIFIIIAILTSNYAGIANVCSQIETTGIIHNLHGKSDYEPYNPLFLQAQDSMNEIYDKVTPKFDNLNFDKINIPNLENNSMPYDIIIENTSQIPPEADLRPPSIDIHEPSQGETLSGEKEIEVLAHDRETGIDKVLFKLLYQGIALITEGEFIYNETRDMYIYSINTKDFDDGDYEILAIAYDKNYNNQTAFVQIKILNNFEFDLDEIELETLMVELTDYINVSFTALATGYYNIQIKNLAYKTIISLVGDVNAYETKVVEVPIDPLYFKSGKYIIVISLTMRNELGFLKTETRELNLIVMKESTKLELDIVEEGDVFTNQFVTLRARLIESDGTISDSGEFIEYTPKTPVIGQILTFEISDKYNEEILGTVVTDSNGFALITYQVDLAKGYHSFNVSYKGTNIYKKYECTEVFENQGEITQISLSSVNSPVKYNELATIEVVLEKDGLPMPDRTLYMNLSNSMKNYYLGLSMTDSNGFATFEFPCNYLPGDYDLIISYNGNPSEAKKTEVFEERLKIVKQSTNLYIVTGSGSTINCPFKYETELIAKILVDQTKIGIEDIVLNFELVLISSGERYFIGTSKTDFTGFASIIFNPSEFNLIPEDYNLIVSTTQNPLYGIISTSRLLRIKSDIPIITIEGTEAFFLESFELKATLTDSLLEPLIGKTLTFYIIDPETEISVFDRDVITDGNGLATLYVAEEEFTSMGTFDVLVDFEGDLYEKQVDSRVKNALVIGSINTSLYIQGATEGIPTESLNITILLTDNYGRPIGGQKVFLECYRIDGTTNLLLPNLYVITNISGMALYSLPRNLPHEYILYAYYNPETDEDPFNDGYFNSKTSFEFKIVRIPAGLSATYINSPRIMRGEVLKFTIEAQAKEAKDYIIPIRIFIDGVNFDHVDAIGLQTIEYGKGLFSYEIPLGPLFQAGVYNFTIEIQPGSLFTGNLTFSIDLVERTLISISYNILNKRALGKHYIWEEEEIMFILVDEDGKPLPETFENELVNRKIDYQIINGKNIFGSTEVSLTDGSFTLLHKPDSYGFETCSAFYKGSRYYAPSSESKQVQVYRRPLYLYFIDYHHDNIERQAFPYIGHREENLLLYARVRDYLNLSYVDGHSVVFGVNGKYLDISEYSDQNGNVILNVPLIEENGLIQAGSYKLSTKIFLSEKFESAENRTSPILQIFEIGYVTIDEGKVQVVDMKYLLKPTIRFFDEDKTPINYIQFYTEVVHDQTNQVVSKKYQYSGIHEIGVFASGDYIIYARVHESNIALSSNIHEIAPVFIQNGIVFLLSSATIEVEDGFIPYVVIPFISDLLYEALQLGLLWEADVWTIIILLTLNIFMGFLGDQLDLTWLTLLQIICVALFCGLIGWEDYYYLFLSVMGIIGGMMIIVSFLLYPKDWLFLVVGVIISTIAIFYAAKKKVPPPGRFRELDWKSSMILIELGILSLAGTVKVLSDRGVWGIFNTFAESIPYILWATAHEYKKFFEEIPLYLALILILIMAFVTWFIDRLIFDRFPVPKGGGIFGAIFRAIVAALRVAFRGLLIAILFAIINLHFSISTLTISTILKNFLEALAIGIVFKIVDMFLASNEFTAALAGSGSGG
jgi:hypothetical protein